jgi:hypothetical protein
LTVLVVVGVLQGHAVVDEDFHFGLVQTKSVRNSVCFKQTVKRFLPSSVCGT